MKQHSGNAISVSVIGGADGPTSIFVAGTGEKRALKARIRDSIYRYKKKKSGKADRGCAPFSCRNRAVRKR